MVSRARSSPDSVPFIPIHISHITCAWSRLVLHADPPCAKAAAIDGCPAVVATICSANTHSSQPTMDQGLT